jgi:ribonuclease HI
MSADKTYTLKFYNGFHRVGPSLGGIPSGGVSIFVQNLVPHSPVDLRTHLQAVAVRVSLHRAVTVCTLYVPPRQALAGQDLEDLIRQLPEPFMLLGDFNAHNPLWGCSFRDVKGRTIEALVDTDLVCLLNDGSHTYLHQGNGSFSAIDLSLCHASLLLDYSWQVLDDQHGSDHYPIVISHQNPVLCSRVQRYQLARADWLAFEGLCRERITNAVALAENPMEAFTQCLQSVADETIPQNSSTPLKRNCPWFDNDCKAAILNRKRALRNFQRSPTNAFLALYRAARAQARRLIKRKKRQSWQSYVSKLTVGTPSKRVWDMIRKISGKGVQNPVGHLVDDGQQVSDPQAIANVLAKHFSHCSSSEHYTPTFQRYKHIQEGRVLDFHSDNLESYNRPFSIHELEVSLASAHNTAVGEDKIHYEMLRHLPATSKDVFLNIINGVWVGGEFPDSWRKAIVIPIPKPGKDPTVASSYRPIALTSCLCKTMERMVNNRLVWYLESNNCLHPCQSGFRKGRSTLDHLVGLEGAIREGFIKRAHTVAVFFDIEKAYDTTWKYGVLRDLHKVGLRGRMPAFIHRFLNDRKFCVRLGPVQSSSYPQEMGVPQGAILSVTLFSLKINTIAECLPNDVQKCLFVDDFTIYYTSCSMPSIERKLQLSLNRLSKWAGENGFKFSQQKTVCMDFCSLRGLHPPPALLLEGQAVPVVQETKFLGVLFDRKLSFKSHIHQLKANCTKKMNLLKVVSRFGWGADKDTLLKLYRAIIRSKLDYASIIYGSARPSYLKVLNTVHHQGLRLALGAFRTSPVPSLYAESGEPPLSIRREKLALQYAAKLRSQPANPAHSSTFQPNCRVAFGNRLNVIPPFGIRLLRYGCPALEHFDSIADSILMPLPPWLLSPPAVNTSLAAYTKGNTSAHVFKTLFIELLEVYRSYKPIYTDGAKSGTATAAAAVCAGSTKSLRLPTCSSIFTAEAYAVARALYMIGCSHQTNFLIVSDSLSTLTAIKHQQSSNPIIIRILVKLHHLKEQGKRVVFVWAPSHIGIIGNEAADAAAKGALARPISRAKVPHSDLRAIINEHCTSKWQDLWSQERGNKLQAIQSSIRQCPSAVGLTRREECVYHRVRIGHTYLTHGFLLRGEAAPDCQICRCPLTVRHILLHCSKFQNQRRLYLKNITDISTVFDQNPPSSIIAFFKNTDIYFAL